MRRPAFLMTLGVVGAVAALTGYEVGRLAWAREATPAILEQVRAAHAHALDWEALPLRHRQALLRVEDPGFHQHHGVDLRTPGAGLTTITQALVKQLYFERFSPGFAKIEQTLIARWVLDPALSKEEQLHLFINMVYLGTRRGQPVHGLRQGALAWWGRPLEQLDDRQFLGLVAMAAAPANLDPVHHRAEHDERVQRIQGLVAGRCAPTGLMDVMLEGCAVGRRGAEGS